MRVTRIAVIAALLGAGVVAGLTAVHTATTAIAMEQAICGAWEPRGGAGDGFQRLCIDGNLYWYEYR